MFALLLTVCLAQTDPFAKWEKSIVEIETRLKQEKPTPDTIVFAGSSSIRLWDLKKSFPEWKTFNAGFGGSQIVDSTHFAERILLPSKPKTIVFYAGDNDIAAKKSAEQVRDDFRAFVARIHKDLPKAKIYFIAVKPSIKRLEMLETQTAANKMVQDDCAKDSRLGFLDITAATRGSDGKPDPVYFQKDGLHLNEKGYATWNKILKDAIK